jgi:membrane protease YdiL (CAAX protease family)
MDSSDSGAGDVGLQAASSTRVSRFRWWIHLVVLGAYPIVVGILGSNRATSGRPALSHHTRGLLMICGVELVVFSAVFALAWLASRISRTDLLWRWRGGFWTVPLGFAYSLVLRLGVGVVFLVVFTGLVLARLVTIQQVQDFARANTPDVAALVDISALKNDPLYFLLSVTFVSFVVAGLREELWRSGFLAGLRLLWPKIFGTLPGQIAAVAVAAFVFGIGHLALGPIGVAAATLLGFGLGVIMVLHRSIWPAVIAHGMFDATTFALLPLISDQLRHGS